MDLRVGTKISYGVYIVTTWSDGKPVGCVANSIMQVTAEPPTFAVSINRNNNTYECIKRSGKFAISILPEDVDPSLIGTFGFKSSRTSDKFENAKYAIEGKLPVLSAACAYIVCDVVNTMDAATHTVFLGEMKAGEINNEKPVMTYAYYHRVIKGGAPKNAPTYVQAPAQNSASEKKFRCDVCGYVYEGDLPQDYVCPICGVGADRFSPLE